LDDLKEARRYWKLKEEAQDRALWRTQFGRGYGPVARLQIELPIYEPYIVPLNYFAALEYSPRDVDKGVRSTGSGQFPGFDPSTSRILIFISLHDFHCENSMDNKQRRNLHMYERDFVL
jgi:hypothetical protein